MRRNKFWILAIMATTLLAFAASGCVEPLENNGPGIDPDAVKLPIRLYIPGAMPATKADSDEFLGFTGDVDGVSPESQIYSVQVWMFNHPKEVDGVLIRGKDTEKAVAYTEATINNWTQNHNIEGSGYYHSGTTENPGHWEAGDIYELPMLIPSNIFNRAINDLRFDFYVLANGSSIGNPASREMSRGELKALTFGNTSTSDSDSDYFGLSNPVFVLSEDGPGLPIAGFFNKSENDTGEAATGVDLKYLHPEYEQGENFDIKAHTPVVQLKRAVSKIRFVFSRPTNMPDVTITDVILDNGIIPNTTWIFENTTNLIPSSGYYSNPDSDIPGTSLDFSLATDEIGQIQDPWTLTSESFNKQYSGIDKEEANAYHDFLTTAIRNRQATEKVVYLRESDKAIKGTIKYRLPGMKDTDPDQSADFEMTLDSDPPKGADYNNFLRNHYWIVYAYFQGGKLYVKPTVAPWVNADILAYTLKMNTNMRLFDSWLYRYDTDGVYGSVTPLDPNNPKTYDNWAGSHMAVSDGRVTPATEAEPVTRPTKSPQIQLVTVGLATFELVVDNTNFEIVRANKNDVGVVTSYDKSNDEGILTISPGVPVGSEVYTYFYIVPKDGVTWVNADPENNVETNRAVKVSLFYNDPTTGKQKVPFNYSSLPGYSDDSSEIWAYYFPEDEYNITGKIRMYFKDNENPLVPTLVQ